MKRPPRPRPLARPALPSRLPRTVRDRGALGLRAAPPLRGIGSLAVTADLSRNIPLPAALVPTPVIPLVPIATRQVAPEITPNRDAMKMRGEYWEVSYQHRQGVIPDCRGLRYLALLVRHTGGGKNPIHAKELTALATGEPAGTIELERDEEVLDTRATRELMKRLEELTAERDRAVAVEDLTRAERLDAEYEQIADELGRAGAKRGATGRKTAFVHDGEKARKAVAKAISEAIARIGQHPDLSSLAEHFASCIRKGQWLSYNGSSDWHIDFTLPPLRK